jgi:hypothetical protein
MSTLQNSTCSLASAENVILYLKDFMKSIIRNIQGGAKARAHLK